MIFSIKPQIFELKCVFSYFRLKTHITLLLPVYVHSWEQRKVREVTDRYDNLRIPVAASLRVAGTTPYYGANGIQGYVDGYTHDGEFILVAEDGANDLKNYPVKCVKGRIWVNNHAHVLQGKYDCADNQFLAYAISQADIESLLVGGGRAKLNAETLMGIDLLLPNKAEQIRIGKYLAQLDNLITLHQCKCQIDGCRFQSPLAITWEQRKLGEMMEVTSVKRIHQSDWTDSGVRFLRARDIVAESKKENVSEPLFISQEKYDEYSAVSGKVKKGDLLVTGVGTIGVPMLINSEEPLYFKDGNIIWFKNENVIDGRFFYYSFNGLNIQKFIKESAGLGTVGTYTIENGKKTPINLPPKKDEQAKIGEYFFNLDHLITLHQCE